MARARKKKLAPARARLKWVFDKYSENDPLVPYLTHHVFRSVVLGTEFVDGRRAPFAAPPPSLANITAYMVERWVPHMVGGGGLAFDAIQAGRLPADGYTLDSAPPLPAQGDTVGSVVDWVLHWLIADVMMNPGYEVLRDCTKLIPHLARWINEAVQFRTAFPGFPTPAASLDVAWDKQAFLTTADAMALGRTDCFDTGRSGWGRVCPSAPLINEPIDGTYWEGMTQAFRSVCDWYDAEHPDLGKFRTWEGALAAAQEWHDQIPVDPSGALIEQGPIVYRWPDGWTVQELVTRQQFQQEGSSLGHCIGEASSFWDQRVSGLGRFFSLRKPGGRPWLTIHVEAPRIETPVYRGVDPDGGPAQVRQIKGCKNRDAGVSAGSADCPMPDPGESTRVWDFLAATPWLVGNDYRASWRLTVMRLGYGNADADPSEWTAEQLIRPPSPELLARGEAVEAGIDPAWWQKNWEQGKRGQHGWGGG